ncbi:MAG: RICIN domain-containing protein [Saprospiraceae bacterium]|nr:RICIN domain-containing protein [Saprospiraceae bacterium]
MDKLYTCAKQGRTLLFTIVLLLITPLSILTFGQSPCSSPVTRQATNGKATNTNIYDDIAIAMTNLLGDGTEAAWVMEGTGTFIENPDGTARFQCVVKQFGDYSTPRRLAVDITLTGKSYSPDASGPYNQTGVSTDSWYYYYGLSGSLKGLDALAGGELSLKIHMHPFQVGIGANQLFNTEDQTSNGAGGWFEWTVVAQPDNSALQFTNYIPGFTVSDIAILLSGTPAEPCPTLGSIGDQVYCDANNNGIFDTGDSTITGLTITLCDANFQTITTQAVDADGKYLFTGLTPGIYNVKFPEATLDGKPQVNLGPINVVLGVGQNYLDADKGYYKPIVCSVNSNFIVKACNDNLPVLNGSNLAGHEYMWLMSTSSCPTDLNQAIVGATGTNFNFTSRPSVTTYLVRIARPVGCTVWSVQNASNCVTVLPTDCDPCANDTIPPTITCPLSINKDVTNMAGTCWTINYNMPTATDNCGSATVTIESGMPSGSCFAVGVHKVIFKAVDAKGNVSRCTLIINITTNISCNVSGNTITKVCVNNIPVLNGSMLANHEYMWLKSTTGCPTQSSQAIVGATGQNYTLPSRVTTTTYFIRCARPKGCTTWGITNESNCVTVYATDCAPINCTVSGNTISKACVNNIPVINGTALANHEYMWLKSTTGCPTQSSQAIAGATGQNYTLPSRVTTTTYFIRCARPVGCTSWSNTGSESNCVTVYATDCAPAACDINFSSTKTYRIINKKSGKAVDVSGAGTNNDCPVIQWTYNAQANQQWRFFSLGSGYFKVMARHSSKYLACHYTSDASKVYQYDYYSGGYKDWKVECVGTTGFYRLVHRASGKVLDVTGGATTDGTKLQIYTWNGSDAQLFKIEEVTTATYSIASNSVLAVNATAESDRVRLGFMSNTGYDNDYYTVEKMNDATGSFEKMSTVNNTQFDDQVQTHVAYDVNPTEGDNFYRVKVTLNDGTEKLTDVKKVTFKRMIGFGAYPNPASDELNVNLSEYTGKAVDIVIYNTFGKVVSREHIDNVANSVYKIDVNEFATGQYLIRVSAEGKRDAAQQVMIQK